MCMSCVLRTTHTRRTQPSHDTWQHPRSGIVTFHWVHLESPSLSFTTVATEKHKRYAWLQAARARM